MQNEKWLQLEAEDLFHPFSGLTGAERQEIQFYYNRRMEEQNKLQKDYSIAYAQQYASAPFKSRKMAILLGQHLIKNKLSENDSQFLAEQSKELTTLKLCETALNSIIDNHNQIKSDKIIKDGVELVKKYWEDLKEKGIPLTTQGATFYLKAFMVLNDEQLSEILEYAGID